MKYVVCVPDGCADEPADRASAGARPLEAAATAHAARRLAARGTVGRAAVIPPGMPPGSDVGNMSILGYDPAVHHTGRAPIEAAALGLRLAARPGGVPLQPRHGRRRRDDARLRRRPPVSEAGGRGHRRPAGRARRRRHRLPPRRAVPAHRRGPGVWADAECVPPHDLSDKPVVLPTGPAAAGCSRLMDASPGRLGRFDVAATQVWLWGQGPSPSCPRSRSATASPPGSSPPSTWCAASACSPTCEVVDVEGATGWYDTDYEGKRDAALDTLGRRRRPVRDPRRGHRRGRPRRRRRREGARRSRTGTAASSPGLVEGLDALGPVAPAAAARPRHAGRPQDPHPDPVPYLLVDSRGRRPRRHLHRDGRRGRRVVPGHELLSMLLQ